MVVPNEGGAEMGNKETSDGRSLETLIAEVRVHLDCRRSARP